MGKSSIDGGVQDFPARLDFQRKWLFYPSQDAEFLCFPTRRLKILSFCCKSLTQGLPRYWEFTWIYIICIDIKGLWLPIKNPIRFACGVGTGFGKLWVILPWDIPKPDHLCSEIVDSLAFWNDQGKLSFSDPYECHDAIWVPLCP